MITANLKCCRKRGLGTWAKTCNCSEVSQVSPFESLVTHRYESPSGAYRVDMFFGDDGILYQRKSGYVEEADAHAETKLVGRLLDDRGLSDTIERLFVCTEVSALDGVSRGARAAFAHAFAETPIQWYVAIYGARPFNRIVARVFRTRTPRLEIDFFADQDAAREYLYTCQQAAAPIHTKGPESIQLGHGGPRIPMHLAARRDGCIENAQFDGVDIKLFYLENWHFRSDDGLFEARYALIDYNILFVWFEGKITDRKRMSLAAKVAHQVYEDLGQHALYIIRYSRRVEGVSFGARKEFIEYLKQWSHREKLCVHIGTPVTRMLLRTMRFIAPSLFANWRGAANIREALDMIRDAPENRAVGTHDARRKIPRGTQPFEHHPPAVNLDELIIHQLVDRLTMITWDVESKIDDVNISPDARFSELFAAIEILERDLRESYQQQQLQLTALAQSQKRLEDAQEIAHLGSWEWYPEADDSFWSDEFYRLLGFEPGALAASYTSFLSRVSATSKQLVEDTLSRIIDTGDSFDVVVHIEAAGTDPRICRLQGQVPDWEDRTNLRVNMTLFDVTRLTEAKLDAEAAIFDMNRGHAILKQHLSTLSHDVRTPLTSLKLGLSRLTDEKSVHRVAPALRAEVEYLDNLFSNMVYLVRLTTGTLGTNRMATNMGDLVEHVHTRLTVAAQDSGIEMAIARPSHPVISPVEPLAMEQALTNLMRHALRYAERHIAILVEVPPDGVSIRIRYDSRHETGTDPAFTQPRLPDWPDVQLSQVQRDLDLSIAIARGIVEHHSGHISVSPHEPGGTEIGVFLSGGAEASPST
ncbi:MAG: HAMP domain-containing sensor histidine kinase [Myxococcota bacterium]|nr:HAMP domain-containing sensor histidine kinase [Myxococcota bacterium]